MMSKDKIVHHIGVVAFPLGTHGKPLLNTIKCLTSLSSPTNHLIFSFFGTNSCLNSLFPQGQLLDFPTIRPFEICRSNNNDNNNNNHNNNDDDDKKSIDNIKPPNLEEVEVFMRAAPESLRAAVVVAEAEVGPKVKCLIGDAFLGCFLGDLAQELGVPWVSCWISGVHSLTIHVYTHLIREHFGANGWEGTQEETLDFIPGLSKIRIRDIPGMVYNDSVFSNMLGQMGQILTRAAAICISCCEEMDQVVIQDLRSKFPNVFPVGPMGLVVDPPKGRDSHQCLCWLDQQPANSVVYVAFGSTATPDPHELVALAEALEASGLKFLWSLKDDLKVHLPERLLDDIKDKGIIIPWAPQIEVLEHEAVGVFITHFGYSSVTESIAAGVPMIGRPFFGDHKLNGRLVEAVWEIGVEIEDGIFTKNGVLKSLDRVLSLDEGKKMKMNITNLSKIVRKAIASGGSSMENFKKLLQVVTMA